MKGTKLRRFTLSVNSEGETSIEKFIDEIRGIGHLGTYG
jgi:hypothetical protein